MGLLPQPVAASPALVLRAWPTGETSAVVALLTADHGTVRAVAKGARLARSPLRPLVQPGRLIEAEFTLAPGRELQYLRGGEVRLDPLGEGATLERSAYLLAALEILDRCRPGEEREPDLFVLGESLVRVLSCAVPGAEAAIYCAFEIALLDLQGVRPQVGPCAHCGAPALGAPDEAGWLDPAAGGLVCVACRARAATPGARPLAARVLAAWPALAAAPARWPREPLPRDVTRAWAVTLHRFLEFHLPGYRLPAALALLRPAPQAPAPAAGEGEGD